MKAEEIKTELEKNYGWNFSSEENMEMYYELFLDVQKVVLRQPPVVGRSEQFICPDCKKDTIEWTDGICEDCTLKGFS
jgi:hypothetical protein